MKRDVKKHLLKDNEIWKTEWNLEENILNEYSILVYYTNWNEEDEIQRFVPKKYISTYTFKIKENKHYY